MNTEEFIEKAVKIHDDKYDYSKVEYNNSKEPICIICKKHGEFWQRPQNHLMGYGCKKCQYEKLSNENKDSKETFIKKAKKLYGDTYDYSKVNYANSQTKVCIICPKHGEFYTTPNIHLDGHICPECANEKRKEKIRMSKEEFLLRARELYGWKYDYSKVEYKGYNEKVCIICPKHGEFWQTPHSHLTGRSCRKCAIERNVKRTSLTTEVFIEKAKKVHGDKYDYSKVEYKNIMSKVIIICPKHGEFLERAEDHINGHGCSKCSESRLEKEISKMLEENKI